MGNTGRVKPGKDACLHSIDPGESVTLSIWTDTLQPCGEITLNPAASPYVMLLKLQDVHKRFLYIHLKVRPQYGGAVKVSRGYYSDKYAVRFVKDIFVSRCLRSTFLFYIYAISSILSYFRVSRLDDQYSLTKPLVTS